MTMRCHLHCWLPQWFARNGKIDFNIAFMLARVILISCSLRRHSLARRNCQQNTKKTYMIGNTFHPMHSNIHHKLYSFWREPCKPQVYQCKKWRNQNYVGHSAQISILFSPLTWLCILKKTFIIPMRLRFYTFIMRHAKTSRPKGPQIKMFWTNFSKIRTCLMCKNCQFCVFRKMFTITIAMVRMAWFLWITNRKSLAKKAKG